MVSSIDISVIIPVYNCESKIEFTAKSLLKTKLRNIEFIFIDDGSTDSSYGILKKIKEIDNRVLLVSQSNKGVSVARNKGLIQAQGKYITFVDSDDYVSSDYFDKAMLKNQNLNLDILITTPSHVHGDKIKIKKLPFEKEIVYDSFFLKNNVIKNLLSTEDLFSVWGKFYKKSFLKENNVFFPEGVRYEEDAHFNINAVNNCKSVMFTEFSGYFYVFDNLSVSKNINHTKKVEIAVNGYKYDYKKNYNLSLAREEINALKEFRFITKIAYVLFNLIIDKSLSLKRTFLFTKEIIQNKDVVKIFRNFDKSIELKLFEKFIFDIVINQSIKKFNLFVVMFKFFYNESILDFLRKINK